MKIASFREATFLEGRGKGHPFARNLEIPKALLFQERNTRSILSYLLANSSVSSTFALLTRREVEVQDAGAACDS